MGRWEDYLITPNPPEYDYEIDYGSLSEAINIAFRPGAGPLDQYDIQQAHELPNDSTTSADTTYWEWDRDSKEDNAYREALAVSIQSFADGDDLELQLDEILSVLAHYGLIPHGRYLINVSW